MENLITPPHTVVIIGSRLISGGPVDHECLSRSFEKGMGKEAIDIDDHIDRKELNEVYLDLSRYRNL